jgi:hypothetical protein
MPRAFDRGLERRWRERLRKFCQSGLSVREFCRSEAVEEYTFFWWRRELARRDRLSKTARLVPCRSRQRRAMGRSNQRRRREGDAALSNSQEGRAFVPVQLISEPLAPSCLEFRLGPCLIRVPTTVDEQVLRQAIRVVREEFARC